MHGKNTMSNQWQERVSYANPRRGWGVGREGYFPFYVQPNIKNEYLLLAQSCVDI